MKREKLLEIAMFTGMAILFLGVFGSVIITTVWPQTHGNETLATWAMGSIAFGFLLCMGAITIGSN